MFARFFRSTGILIALAALLVFAGSVWAGPSGFRIDSYIPERFTDLQWTISGSSYLRGSSDRDDYYDNVSTEQTESSAQSLSAGSSATWRYITVPRFLTLDMSLESSFRRYSGEATRDVVLIPAPEYSTSTESEYTAKYVELLSRPRFDGGIYVWNDAFLSATASLNSQYRNGPSEDEDGKYHYYIVLHDDRAEDIFGHNHSKTTGNYRSHDLSCELLPGFGRVYEGNYAATSLYILDAVKGRGLLTREPQIDEMRALTDLVYTYRLRHTPDKRIRRIEALSAIADFLQKSHITDTLGAAGYLALQDVWDYYPVRRRQFGFRVRSGIGASYGYSSTNTSETANSFDTIIDYTLSAPEYTDTTVYSNEWSSYRHSSRESHEFYALAMVEYFRPLAMKWQLDGEVRTQYFFDEWSVAGDYRTDYDQHSRSSLSAMLSYIPDSRTSASIRFVTSYDSYRDRERYEGPLLDPPPYVPYSPDRHSFAAELRGNVTYRIAIPTTLSIDGSLAYYESENTTQQADLSNRSFNLSASINHFIF